jgi:hypothetical protein
VTAQTRQPPLCRPAPKHLGRDTIVIDAKLLAADRALDQAWRGGVGVARAVTRAQELSDPLRLDVLLDGAKAIVSDRHSCSPEEASARLFFVSWHTNRRLRDIASEVVTYPQGGFAEQSTPVSTGSRCSQEAGGPRWPSQIASARTRGAEYSARRPTSSSAATATEQPFSPSTARRQAALSQRSARGIDGTLRASAPRSLTSRRQQSSPSHGPGSVRSTRCP